ncbi:HDIG domain-containing protein [Odoribacter sp. OttesenSCG-928-J03]|nr:HDIG domain-containing protein [Odoribacter sp. OttesenSCG-928-J03]MDL2283199.1 HDIG domain-containing protein [Odoribacter sp. OttesenSCG-928-G04]
MNHLRRRINIILRIAIVLVVCAVSVAVLPKSENFRYEYQVGALWRYETLKAPFDFPVYKTEAGLEAERERIANNQVPIFNLNETIKTKQIGRFASAIARFRTPNNEATLNMLQWKLEEIYDAGIIQLPEKFSSESVKTIKIVESNIGQDVDINSVYTLKSAYTTLSQYINKLHYLSSSLKDEILNLNINAFIVTNLDYDISKTNLELANRLQNISLTQGMIHAGEIVINKSEIVTQEKFNVLNSLKLEYRHNVDTFGSRIRMITGLALLSLAAILVFATYFYFFRKRKFYDNRNFIFLFCSFLATILLGSIAYHYNINILAIPVLFLIIITNILIDKRSAFYLLLGSSMLVSYFAPNSYMYLFMQITAGTVAIFSLSQLQRRGQLFLAILLIFIAYAAIYIAFTFVQEGEFKMTHAFGVVFLGINCLVLTLAYLVVYIFERIFGFISEITLIELSNPNHPALRDLTKKAPGTFQHSLMVANLAEEVIHRIGGSPLLVRTGALYHDIGKSVEPIYFVENQPGGINPHSKCDFDESAQHIIGHVAHGVALAKKYNLPDAIVDFIRTHHGKGKAKFFYNSYKNKYPDRPINEALFSYAGPDPVTKECAVLMMADAVEAATRSLPDKAEENIRKLVNDLINGQVADGRFDNADLTFRDISVAKEIFSNTLVTIYHSRISYPKLKEEEKKTEEDSSNQANK